jgi:hypothetical protein
MDQPGGGDSGQPFIKSPIETPNTPTEFKDLYSLNRTSLDFPIRGGSISSLVTGAYTTQAALVDAERIKKFFKSAPRGTAFIQKQRGLQLTNPITQVPNSLQFVGIDLNQLVGIKKSGNAVIPTTQTYNPANTLAQVAVQGNGAHFNRQGVSPTIYEAPQQTYQYIVGNPENNTEATNRLSILKALKIIGTADFIVNPLLVGGTGIDPTLVDRLGISTIQNQLFNYSGGPGSTYGIGFTRIFRYSNTDTTNLLSNSTVGFTVGGDETPGGISKPYSVIALTYRQLAKQSTRTTNPTSPTQAKIQDFRAQTNNGNPLIPISDYSLRNIASYKDNNIGIGNPGSPLKSNNYISTKVDAIDQVNAKNLFYYNSTTSDPWVAGGKNSTKDIIKFAFECISNDNPDAAVAIVMRAFLEGQISDTNAAEYNSFKYLGRGETFRTYQGFNRTISFTFKIFAQTRVEMKPLYQKLNNLISQVYPDYSPTSHLMRGSVVRLTIGDYIYRMPGFLQNVNVTIDNGNTPWEIVLNNTETDVAQLPHMVTVQCTFLPIMDILPRREMFAPPSLNQYVPLIVNNGNFTGSLGITDRRQVIANPLDEEAFGPDLSVNPILIQRNVLQPATIDKVLTGQPIT